MAFSPLVARTNTEQHALSDLWHARAASAKDMDIAEIITAMTVNKAGENDRAATNRFASIRAALSDMPPQVIRALYARGWRIEFARKPDQLFTPEKLNEVMPELEHDPYKRRSRRHIAGMASFEPRHLYVTMQAQDPLTGLADKQQDVVAVMRHEVAHALQDVLYSHYNFFYHNREFFRAYWADVRAAGGYAEIKKAGYNYYTNAGALPSRGYYEVFAETMADLLGGGIREGYVTQWFPRFAAMVKHDLDVFLADPTRHVPAELDSQPYIVPPFLPRTDNITRDNLPGILATLRNYMDTHAESADFSDIQTFLQDFCMPLLTPEQLKNAPPNEHTHDMTHPRLIYHMGLSRVLDFEQQNKLDHIITSRALDALANAAPYTNNEEQMCDLVHDTLDLVEPEKADILFSSVKICLDLVPHNLRTKLTELLEGADAATPLQKFYFYAIASYITTACHSTKTIGQHRPNPYEPGGNDLLISSCLVLDCFEIEGATWLANNDEPLNDAQFKQVRNIIKDVSKRTHASLMLAGHMQDYYNTLYKASDAAPVIDDCVHSVSRFIGTQAQKRGADEQPLIAFTEDFFNFIRTYLPVSRAQILRDEEIFEDTVQNLVFDLARLTSAEGNPHYEEAISAINFLIDRIEYLGADAQFTGNAPPDALRILPK